MTPGPVTDLRIGLADPAVRWALLAGLVAGAVTITLFRLLAAPFLPLPSARVAFFMLLLATAGTMALLRGGAPERWVGAILLAQVPAQFVLDMVTRRTWTRMDPGMLVLDLAILAALMPVMLRANRYWPIAIAALQLCAVMVHGVKATYPDLHPLAYGILRVVWGYMMLPVLVGATWRHRVRLRRLGVDRAWSTRHEPRTPGGGVGAEGRGPDGGATPG